VAGLFDTNQESGCIYKLAIQAGRITGCSEFYLRIFTNDLPQKEKGMI
jgi:hypothetical protein